ncbi:hypothetical protein EJB05_45006, partial [Eragrostis curvula]
MRDGDTGRSSAREGEGISGSFGAVLCEKEKGRTGEGRVGRGVGERQPWGRRARFVRGRGSGLRYLIIVDDLWNLAPWDTIRCAFIANNQKSRVIITTQHVDVARACCTDHRYIHYMQPLILREILKKCGGLPLAMITISSILACQQPGRLKEQWECIQNSLANQSATNPTLDQMVHILDLSYKSLPHHLKSCFLSMIQPEYDAYSNEVVQCRVHDMMLDLILRRCEEDNFLIAVRDPQEVAEARY